MGKKFSTKKLRLRARSQKRRQDLKINPPTFGVKSTPEINNLEVIRSLDSKVKAAQAAE